MKKDIKRIVLAAGGTGGHLFPAEALAHALYKQGMTPVIIYDERVQKWVGESFKDFECYKFNTPIFTGSIVRKTFSLLHTVFLVFKLALIFNKLKIKGVVGFGGYTSVASILAGKLLWLDCFLHEQNAVLGRANRVMLRFAKALYTSFEDTEAIPMNFKNKVKSLGFLVRKKFFSERKAKTLKALKIVVIGGSQGAKILSDYIPEVLIKLTAEKQINLIIHQQAREEMLVETKAKYKLGHLKAKVEPFFNNIDELMFEADIIIARAGASTIAEVTALGKAALFIPYAFATDNHQFYNAMHLKNQEACEIIEQRDASVDSVCKVLEKFLDIQYRQRLAKNARKMSGDKAAEHFADDLQHILGL